MCSRLGIVLGNRKLGPERRQQHLEFRVCAARDRQIAASKPSVRQQGALRVFPYADEKIAAAMISAHPPLRRHRLQHAVGPPRNSRRRRRDRPRQASQVCGAQLGHSAVTVSYGRCRRS